MLVKNLCQTQFFSAVSLSKHLLNTVVAQGDPATYGGFLPSDQYAVGGKESNKEITTRKSKP